MKYNHICYTTPRTADTTSTSIVIHLTSASSGCMRRQQAMREHSVLELYYFCNAIPWVSLTIGAFQYVKLLTNEERQLTKIAWQCKLCAGPTFFCDGRRALCKHCCVIKWGMAWRLSSARQCTCTCSSWAKQT